MSFKGSTYRPMTLAEALADTRIKPGHTLYLKRGVYRGDFASALTGVTVRPLPGEWATVVGSLSLDPSSSAPLVAVIDGAPLMWQDWSTDGGDGGDTLHVTNLNNDGEGSLRAALTASGARTVVFDVSGTIALEGGSTYQSKIRVTNPYLTIAGDTAPEEGITIRGKLEIVGTHDVIVRHLRIRPGPDVYDPGNGDGIHSRDSHHVLIEHCSVSWTTDESIEVWGPYVTVRYCIASEALMNATHPEGAHSMGVFASDNIEYFRLDRSLIAHCRDRAPLVAGLSRVTNNVIYNADWSRVHAYDDPVTADWLNNYFKAGPDTQIDRTQKTAIRLNPTTMPYFPVSRVYGGGNVLDGYDTQWYSNSEKAIVCPAPLFGLPDGLLNAEDAYADVLANAGAMPRDAIDARIVAEVEARNGMRIDDPSQVGGWL